MSDPPSSVIGSNTPLTILPKRVSRRVLPPPTAPTLWHAAQELSLKTGPSPSAMPSTSWKFALPALKRASSAAVKFGSGSPKFGGLTCPIDRMASAARPRAPKVPKILIRVIFCSSIGSTALRRAFPPHHRGPTGAATSRPARNPETRENVRPTGRTALARHSRKVVRNVERLAANQVILAGAERVRDGKRRNSTTRRDRRRSHPQTVHGA